MIGRISDTFDALKTQGRAGLVTFIMGGDPDITATLTIMRTIAKAGADIIEVGIPFSDPMADGPVIQAAGLRALKKGVKLRNILGMIMKFREHDENTPVILMGYYNPVYHYGLEEFCHDARQAGVDGIILVDLPPEEEGEFRVEAEKVGLALIRLVAPTSLENRLPLLLPHTQGFVYYISVTGITGGKSAQVSGLKEQVTVIKSHTKLPVAVGFGVKTPLQAREIGEFADAVVVGSALVDVIAKSDKPAEDAALFVQSLADALKK